MDQIDALAGLLCLGAIGYVLMAMRLLRGPREPGDLPFALTSLALGTCVMAGSVQLLAITEFAATIGQVGYTGGAALAAVGLLVAFRAYTGVATPATITGALLVIPICSLFVAATNAQHGMMWSGPAVSETGGFLMRPEKWGIWFVFVQAPYSYTVVGAALFRLLVHSSHVGASQRRGLLALMAASLVPFAAILVYDAGLGSAALPFVPMILAAMLPVYVWLILGQRVADFSPIAYETVFRNMADPIVVLDDKGRVVSLNGGAEELLHIRESGAFRRSLDRLFGDEMREVCEAIETGEPRKLMTASGRFLHVRVSCIDNGGSTMRGGRVLMFRDMSDVERAQTDVRDNEILLRTLFDHSVNGLVRLRWRKDTGSAQAVLRCVSANKAAAGFLGIDADEVVDMPVDDLLAIATGGMSGQEAASILDRFHASVAAGEVIDTEVRPRDAEPRHWLRMIGEVVGDKVALTFVDATSTKAREQEMASIATTDPLTGVLNRRGFEQKASALLAESPDDATGALLFIDLNQFKQINDRCGHEAGDELLKIAAHRLQRSLRPRDIIGRPGGDEFVALVPRVSNDIAEDLAERLVEALEQPYHIGDHTLFCSASIGMALYPDHATTLTGLLRSADEAMYRAKSRAYGLKKASRRHLLEKAG